MTEWLVRGAISRRSLLRGGALGGLGLATAAVIGCGGDDDEEAAAPAATPVATVAAAATPEPAKTATLRFAATNPIPTLSPNSTAASESDLHAIYDALTRQHANDTGGAIEPGLATSWETPSGDGRTWVFNLREAEWSDGTKFTAEDVAWVHDFYKDPDSQSRLFSRVGTYESSKVIDDRTIEITTDYDPIFPKREGIVFILPKHIFADGSIDAEAFMGETPVSTGAYIGTNFLQGQRVDLVQSPATWHTNGGFTKVEYNWLTETTTRVAAFETNEIDFILGVPDIDTERVRGFNNVTTGGSPGNTNRAWDFANMPDKDPSPTNDPRVRAALNHALDRDGIIRTAYGGNGVPAKDQLLAQAVFGHQPDWAVPAYDPDLAKQYLRDAGFPNGTNISIDAQILTAASGKPILEATIGLWDDVGVTSDVRTIEVNVWRDRLYGRATEGRPGAFLMGWSSFLYEGALALQWHESSNPYGLWDNPEFDRLFEAVNKEVDGEERFNLYRQLMETERVENGGPSAFMNGSDGIIAWYHTVLDSSSYTPWTTPTIFFSEVSPA